MLRLDRASVILCLDADPLLTDPETIRHARGFADGRRAGALSTLREPQGRPEPGRGATGSGQASSGAASTSSGQAMNRLYAVEGIYSLTGAMADHRLRLESRQIAAFLAALAARLGAPGASSQAGADVSGVDQRWIDAVAKDLLANRGKGLIVAGERQPAGVHAAVCALNAHLGNTGKTVSYYETKDAALPSVSSLTSLVSAMKGGAVDTLVILGGNPVYDAPADLDFASAMAKVPHTLALGHTVDETSSSAEWHIPRAHYLESWGDARAVGGTLSVVQPLILPLFGGRTPVEVLGLMIADKDRPGHDIVRDTWKPILGEAEFDKKWNRVLHDGLLAGSELTEVVPAVKGEAFAELARATGSASGLEIVFVPSPSLHDGRFANDGWLQELPDPLTKLTWDNPALVSPKTAETLDLANEELVRLDYAGRSLELPVWILPGMADGVLALTLGYGRRRAGRIGSEVGFDTFKVRASTAPGFDSGVRVTKLGRTHPLSATQDHGSMEGRPLVRESTVAELQSAKKEEARPGALGVFEEEPEHFSLWKEHTYDQGHQWGMTIDLNTCIGCNACMVACQSENNVPVVGKIQVAKQREMHWLRVDRYFSGEPSGNPEIVFQPVPCMQCEDAPCEQVCPVAATVHDAEGLNVMVYNRCIGTRYCSNNCPYKVRHFNFFNFTKDTPDILKLAMNPDVTVRARGVMEKCSYCTQRISRAKIDAKLAGRELRDGDVKTACQQACPASAIEFGDIRDKSSRVAKAKADPRNYALLEELNTKPRTTYLAKVRNPNPDLEERPGA
jgi:molybdopterin-containing oxidoreductase family iron-sulfur binding subunit